MLTALRLKKKLRIQEQKFLIDILSDKMLLYPEIMSSHFNNLFLMKNKQQLKEYLSNFIRSSSKLGYANFDMRKMIMAMRLLYPDPKQLDKELTLDFLILLSISDTYYKSMDKRSVAYVEEMLDIVEDNLSAKQTAHIDMAS